MGVLPVVDCLIGVFRGVRNAGSQVNGELADVGEACCVADVWI